MVKDKENVSMCLCLLGVVLITIDAAEVIGRLINSAFIYLFAVLPAAWGSFCYLYWRREPVDIKFSARIALLGAGGYVVIWLWEWNGLAVLFFAVLCIAAALNIWGLKFHPWGTMKAALTDGQWSERERKTC